MTKRMLIDALHPEETRVVIADEKQIYDFDFVSAAKKQLKGNIYLAKITRVEPSLQAAFVEYGGNRQGFLPFSEIHPDYYQIPISDRKRLLEETDHDSVQEDAPESNGNEDKADAQQETEAPDNSSEGSLENDTPAYLAQPLDADESEFAVEEAEAEASGEASGETPAEDNEKEQAAPAEGGEESSGGNEGSEEKSDEGLETLPNEEEELRSRPKRNYAKRYKIQEVIRRGQIVLVQVIKEERGNKGASLTTYLSLAGRYCVLMPNSPKDGGISRKIASPEDRKRLKQIAGEFKFAKGMSVIIRTAGMGRTHAEIKRDYDYLVKLWNLIREATLKSNAPSLIYEESDIIKRSIRDQYTSDMDEIVVEGKEAYDAAREFMKLLLASHTPKIKLHDEPTPLFYSYNIEDQLLQMHDPVVKLKSGGYIVINPTEALISIDVNSGRATGERNIEETATKTNLEAAAEVARQLRLRDLAGLIVIDFIDMMESRHRRSVEKALKEALKADRAKIQLGRISPFGLLEMSRQRLRPSISETNMVQCPHCSGRGYIRSNESMSIQILRALEKEAATGSWSGFRLICPTAVGLHLLNTKRENLSSMESRHQVAIQVLIDANLALSEYNLEKMRRSQNEQRKNRREQRVAQPAVDALPDVEYNEEMPQQEEMADASQTDDSSDQSGSNERGNRSRRRRGRRGGRNRRDQRDNKNNDDNAANASDNNAQQQDDSQETVEANDNDSNDSRGDSRSRRGRRGRRRWRDRDGESKGASSDNSDGDEPVATNDNAEKADGETLPAFTRQEPIVRSEPEPEPVAATANYAHESTPRDPNAAPKKGWWQKMIELDD